MIDFEEMMRKHEELRRREKVIDMLWERATNTTITISDMPRNRSDGKTQERSIVGMVDAKEACRKTRQELNDIKRNLRREMKRLKKWQHIDSIKKRYLEGKTISAVASEIGYEWSQTNRYLNEAKAIINRTDSGKKME